MRKLVAIVLCALFAIKISFATEEENISLFDAAYQTEFKILMLGLANQSADLKKNSVDEWFSKWIKSSTNIGLIISSMALETKSPLTDVFRANMPIDIGPSIKLSCERLHRDIQERNSNKLREGAELFDEANRIGEIAANQFTSNFIKRGRNQHEQQILTDLARKPDGAVIKAIINIRESTIQGYILGMIADISPACDCAYKNTVNTELNNICENISDAGRLRQKLK